MTSSNHSATTYVPREVDASTCAILHKRVTSSMTRLASAADRADAVAQFKTLVRVFAGKIPHAVNLFAAIAALPQPIRAAGVAEGVKVVLALTPQENLDHDYRAQLLVQVLAVNPCYYAAGLANSLLFRPAAGSYGMHVIFPAVADMALNSPILAVAQALLRDTMTPEQIAQIIVALKTADDVADVRAVCESFEHYNPPRRRGGNQLKSFNLRASEFAELIVAVAMCPKNCRPAIGAARDLLTEEMGGRDYLDTLVAVAVVLPTRGMRELFPAILALAQKSVLKQHDLTRGDGRRQDGTTVAHLLLAAAKLDPDDAANVIRTTTLFCDELMLTWPADDNYFHLMSSGVVVRLMADVAKVAPAARRQTFVGLDYESANARLLKITQEIKQDKQPSIALRG